MVKFKYYHTGSTFNSSNLSNDDIAFVEESGSLWTHGHEYKLTDTVTDIQDNVNVNNTAFQNTGDGFINFVGIHGIDVGQTYLVGEAVGDGGQITYQLYACPEIHIGLVAQNNTSGSYGDSSAQTPSFGSTFKVPYITTNSYGIVTAISDHTVTLPTPTTYESKQAANGGTAESLVTTGEKYAWNNKQKAIAEGRGITITTEANADTVSLNLPIYEGGGDESIQEGRGTAFGDYSHAEGNGSVAAGDCSHAEGINSRANGFCSHAECWNTTASGNYSHAEGSATTTSNNSEHASGQYNESNRASTTFGDSGNTLFSVGNGTADNTRHNAFEIRQNGDIYLTLGGQDVKLQDNLGNKVDNTTTVNGHALSGNVTVTKSDVGLGNVGNYKAVSTEANQGLTSTEQSNARANIGAGTSNFSGSYNDLSDKPTIPTVYTWAQASTKPTYTLSEVGATVSVSAISSNTSSTCSITGSGNAGKIQTIIYTNSTSSDLTVTVPTTYTTPDGAAIELTCPSGGYCEVSYLNVGGTIYARGI